jgi:hypothetical protein
MVEHGFDGAVDVLIEFFNELFFNAVYDVLYPDVDDRLL